MSPQNVQQQTTGEASIDFSVVIAASAPVEDTGGLVHAVTVIQPAQTWTVIRGHDDFLAVAQNLSSQIMDLPALPEVAKQFQGCSNDLHSIVTVRTHLQHWLDTILMYPGARDSPAISNFLTYAPNMIPPQYENVSWTIFTADGQVASPTTAQGNPQTASTESSGYDDGNLDDMAMDVMFDTGDGDDIGQHDDDDSDGEEEYRASIRYKACDDPITEEDQMDLQNVIAGEVEMVDDVGSLAQSLGASHLGRSIMLQEETIGNNGNRQAQHQGIPQAGLQLGGAMTGGGSGGIGSAMKHATSQQIGTSFNQVKPESAPRLDAFKMIKVIGKGSFGEFECMTETEKKFIDV